MVTEAADWCIRAASSGAGAACAGPAACRVGLLTGLGVGPAAGLRADSFEKRYVSHVTPILDWRGLLPRTVPGQHRRTAAAHAFAAPARISSRLNLR